MYTKTRKTTETKMLRKIGLGWRTRGGWCEFSRNRWCQYAFICVYCVTRVCLCVFLVFNRKLEWTKKIHWEVMG